MQVGPDVQRKIVKACVQRKKRALGNTKHKNSEAEQDSPIQTQLPF
jgi:hypothetical protein